MCEGTAEEFRIIPQSAVRDGFFERQFWGLPAAGGTEYRLAIGDAAELVALTDGEVFYRVIEPEVATLDEFRAAACS